MGPPYHDEQTRANQTQAGRQQLERRGQREQESNARGKGTERLKRQKARGKRGNRGEESNGKGRTGSARESRGGARYRGRTGSASECTRPDAIASWSEGGTAVHRFTQAVRTSRAGAGPIQSVLVSHACIAVSIASLAVPVAGLRIPTYREADRLEDQQLSLDPQLAVASGERMNDVKTLMSDAHSVVVVINAAGIIQVRKVLKNVGLVRSGLALPLGVAVGRPGYCSHESPPPLDLPHSCGGNVSGDCPQRARGHVHVPP